MVRSDGLMRTDCGPSWGVFDRQVYPATDVSGRSDSTAPSNPRPNSTTVWNTRSIPYEQKFINSIKFLGVQEGFLIELDNLNMRKPKSADDDWV